MPPRDPQDAGERVTRTIWRNQYADFRPGNNFSTREACEAGADPTRPRIAIERVETTITRIPVQEEQ